MTKKTQPARYFHLHLVSDSTGETLLAVGRAACAQYATVSPIEHVYPLIRNQKQLDPALASIESNPGIVLYTLVDRELAGKIEEYCRHAGVPCLSILGPVLSLFQSYLGAESTPRIGGQHMLNVEYFRRIDALNFTMMHDDGQHVENLEEAEVVLVGVSRTSKHRRAFISPTAESEPPMFRWCQAFHPRHNSTHWRSHWLSACSPARSAS